MSTEHLMQGLSWILRRRTIVADRTAILLLTALTTGATWGQSARVALNEGWSFRQVGTSEWRPAVVPGNVQSDLMRNGLLPDPMRNANVDSVQWVEGKDWEYRRTFNADATLLKNGHVDLIFKGLDTYASVYLNDSLLGSSDNMFCTWEWPVKDRLKQGANELRVVFRSPIVVGAEIRKAYGFQLPHDSDPTGTAPFVRKAAYQFGWDLAPRLVTMGIWQEVELRTWNVGRFKNIKIDLWPENTSSISSNVDVRARTFTDVPDGTEIKKSYRFGEIAGGNTSKHVKNHRLVGEEVDATVLNVRLWEPGATAKASLQPMTVELTVGDMVQDKWQAMVGARTIRLDQDKDSVGKAFRFLVNDKPVFMKGCNLVPPTSMPMAGQDSLWLARVKDMQRAGMNMVRVWAGGIYPPDAFYLACDTAGILVWQDFMFGYLPPGDEANLERSLPELREQVTRLWNHPSLALFCGNNELNVALKNWGWQKTYHLDDQRSKRITKEYEGLFEGRAREIAEWASLYTPTSPLSNWGNAEGLRNGDLHYWGVWHGDEPFSSFGRNVGRFVSEYGFQSYPDSTTLATQLDPEHLVLGSPMLAKRQKSYKGDGPIWTAIEREFAVKPRYLGEFILFSQLAQSEAYHQAIWAHVTGQPHCMGTLFWQLNDVWAGPSWSTVDHTGTWKAAMYEVTRSYAPTVLDLAFEGDSLVARVWNERQDLKKAQVVIQVFGTDGTVVLSDSNRIMLGQGEREVLTERIGTLLGGGAADHHVVRVALQDGAGTVVAERMLPFKRMGEMAWEKAGVRVERMATSGGVTTYRLSADKPVPVVKLEGKGLSLSDNFFPLFPGIPKVVSVSGPAPDVRTWP